MDRSWNGRSATGGSQNGIASTPTDLVEENAPWLVSSFRCWRPATLWGFVQLVMAAQAANVQYGLRWAESPRDDEMPPLRPIPGRISRNFRNYMETLAFFAAAVLLAEAVSVHDGLTHWGAVAYLAGRIGYAALYISGIPLIRSGFWNVAAFGMLAILVAPLVAR